MSVRQVYFTQDCQVCGRPMRVRLELFGKRICCAHCNASCHAGSLTPGRAAEPSRGRGVGADRTSLRDRQPAGRSAKATQPAGITGVGEIAGASRQVINPVVMRAVYRPGGGDGNSVPVFLH